ncbi:MAG: hypothetical protein DCC67_13365 [Planctomycetota bacterium]|nr:MAG: hypothetical protein DCC67_13365 [Planctomycetota bacterium]
MRKAVGWQQEPEKPQPQVPVRMVATWADTTLTKGGAKPVRGFGGRLLFFGRDSEDPVRVEGDLVVYAFDETSRPPHETQPTRKYIFPMEEFVRHESESKLGPSYSFWLPWDEVGGPQRKISLIARFQPKQGAIVLSEQTRHLLPGPTEPPRDGPLIAAGERSALVESIRTASHAAPFDPAATAGGELPHVAATGEKKQMLTATIALPSRLKASVVQPSPSEDRQDDRSLPLSQIAAMRSGRADGEAPTERPIAPSESAGGAAVEVASPGAAPTARRAATAVRGASGSLRDSLLETLPAQARQAGRSARGRVQ